MRNKTRFDLIPTFCCYICTAILVSIFKPFVCILSDNYCNKIHDTLWQITIGCLSMVSITLVFNKFVPGFKAGWYRNPL